MCSSCRQPARSLRTISGSSQPRGQNTPSSSTSTRGINSANTSRATPGRQTISGMRIPGMSYMVPKK